jgi:hypothetical protein
VGVISRKARRRIVNEDDVIDFISSSVWRRNTTQPVDTIGNTDIDSSRNMIVVEVRRLDFGSVGTVELDIQGIQDVDILFGLQGSGMINGLYLPRVSDPTSSVYVVIVSTVDFIHSHISCDNVALYEMTLSLTMCTHVYFRPVLSSIST